MANRLAQALSPYLLQHKDNPVDWFEWGDEAFAQARRRDVPILLSVGYAACHWCHVMAHESFEDTEVAEALADFVCIKVDREERPDVDAAYMSAVQAMSGHGGWPMTAFLTPTGEPFHAGTYYPQATFLQLISAISHLWQTRRGQVVSHATTLVAQLTEALPRPHGTPIDAEVCDQAVDALLRTYDPRRGGFGEAPKFPPSMVLAFLLRHGERTADPRALAMAETTMVAMARGGLYDQLGGGFARYSVDAGWVVPHFEKMLYDNALLIRVYAHWWRMTGHPLADRVVRECIEFLLRDLRTDDGAFASALDADADGIEGLTYTWSLTQLDEVLGTADGRRAAQLLGVGAQGTFEQDQSTLQLRTDPEDRAWWATTRDTLFAHRGTRPQPARDDKVITSWNGLAIAALAEAGILFDESAWVQAAVDAADHLARNHFVGSHLRRASRSGLVSSAAAVADDYGNLAEGLVSLYQATMDSRWLVLAGDLLRYALDHFRSSTGGFHDTAHDAPPLFLRADSAADNAEPSGQSALAGALLAYGALTGDSECLGAAGDALMQASSHAQDHPRFAGWSLAVAEAHLRGPLQLAVCHDETAVPELLRVARRVLPWGSVLVHGTPDHAGVHLLAGHTLHDGRATAYLCRGQVCLSPVTEPKSLRDMVIQ